MISERKDGTSTLELQVVSDHVEPCSYCGIPCTGTVRFWYVDGQRRVAFEVNRPTLDEILEVAVQTAITSDTYPHLPPFVRSWNESVGWAAQAFDESTPMDAVDILTMVELLTAGHLVQDPRVRDVLAALFDFTSKCCSEPRQLWVCVT